MYGNNEAIPFSLVHTRGKTITYNNKTATDLPIVVILRLSVKNYYVCIFRRHYSAINNKMRIKQCMAS